MPRKIAAYPTLGKKKQALVQTRKQKKTTLECLPSLPAPASPQLPALKSRTERDSAHPTLLYSGIRQLIRNHESNPWVFNSTHPSLPRLPVLKSAARAGRLASPAMPCRFWGPQAAGAPPPKAHRANDIPSASIVTGLRRRSSISFSRGRGGCHSSLQAGVRAPAAFTRERFQAPYRSGYHTVKAGGGGHRGGTAPVRDRFIHL